MSSTEELYNQALADYRHDRVDDAVNKLKKVVEQNPGHEDAFESLAVITYNLKKYDDAIAIIQQWVALNPDSAMAQTNLSRCYVAKGLIEMAEAAQAKAQQLAWKADGKEETAPEATDEQNQERIERFKQIIDLDPNDVLGYYSLGSTYLDTKQYALATKTLGLGLTKDPNHSSSYLALGNAYEKLGKSIEAINTYKEGIAIANQQGDMIPLKKMEQRLVMLKAS